jgi:uncharacterized protein YutE (UPF0331/DUF86 family)
MTPRRFDRAVVERKLQLLDGLLTDLEDAGAITANALRGDRMLRHAVERLLTQIVQLAVDVNAHIAVGMGRPTPSDYRNSFRDATAAGALPEDLSTALLPSVGLRNLLVHEYAAIDLDLVAGACTRAVIDYRTYVREVSRFLQGMGAT